MSLQRPGARPFLLGFSLLMVSLSGTSATKAESLTTPLVNPLVRPALQNQRATNAVLLALTHAGKRLVAVGERGIILWSDDAGVQWQQAKVPVSNTLTAVRFVDAKQGWAVGHGGLVLASSDAGASWVVQLDGQKAAALALQAAQQSGDAPALQAAQRLVADGPDKPFLDVYFSDASHGFVVGAYGLIYGTKDGGKSWTPWMGRLNNPKALHLNAIATQGSSVMVVGEQGLLLHSPDGGASFSRLPSPYEGSWFAVTALPGKRWLVGGLKGRLYNLGEQEVLSSLASSAAASPVFTAPLPVTLTALNVLRDGNVLALNQSGQLQLSRDNGASLQTLKLPPGPPLTQVLEVGEGRLLGVSLRGFRELPLPKSAP